MTAIPLPTIPKPGKIARHPRNPHITASPPTPALLTLALIQKIYVPMGLRTLHRWVSSGAFPRPDIAIGNKVRYWRKETVEAWIAAQSREGAE